MMNNETKKLYRITCKGMTGSMTGTAHGVAYVVARNPDEAYKIMRESLDKRDLGFRHERELDKIELLAEDKDYPDCRVRLYANSQQED